MISKDKVIRISKLAKLNLTKSELEKFAPQLSKILKYVAKLKKVDASKVIPTSHVISGIKNRFQETDRKCKHLNQEGALSNAKQEKDGYFSTEAIL